jgi:hypothetical protein
MENKKKKLFIHIGLHKTGTSSIQRFLHINRESILLKDKIYYLPVPQDDIAPWQHRFLNKLMVENESEFYNYFEKNINVADNFIISSECFVENDIYREKLITLSRFFDEMYVVVFLRRQDCWLESLYKQVVMYDHRIDFSFEKWIEIMLNGKYLYFDCNYLNTLNLWAGYFGKRNIIVIPYEDHVPGSNSVKVFCKKIGINIGKTYKAEIYENKSVNNRELLEIVRLTNKLLYIKWQHELINYLVIENDTEGEINLVSKTNRDLILNNYKAMNSKIANEFTQHKCLFNDNHPKQLNWIPFKGISKINKIIVDEYLERKTGSRLFFNTINNTR